MSRIVTVSGHFVADVVYEQPDFEELKRLFPAFADYGFKGRKFLPIERCKGVSLQRRTVTFEYIYTDGYVSMYAILKEMDRAGLRPALYEELIGFVRAYPDEQVEHAIIAVGSLTDVRDNLFAACLSCRTDGRGIRLDWSDGEWSKHDRFLAVRE